MNIKMLLISAILVINGCKNGNEDNNGKYYELNFTDEVYSVMQSDSTHIVIQQYGPINLIKDSIPYSVVNENHLDDTIKLKMDVKFGSYSQTPSPIRQITTNKDTLFLWYASSPLSMNKLAKASTIEQVEEEPKANYYSIQSVIIIKSINKYVTFRSENKSQ